MARFWLAFVTYWLRDAGYFTANVRRLTDDPKLRRYHYGTGKTHLNFRLENNRFKGAIWVEGDLFDSDQWQDLKVHQPFFAQISGQIVLLLADHSLS